VEKLLLQGMGDAGPASPVKLSSAGFHQT